MEQLTQNLRNGEMKLVEAPWPTLREGWLLVRNHYSLVSAGTEGKTVSDARKGMIGKALSRKNEVEKVIKSAKVNGLMKTYRMVMDKLDSPVSLGYSCAGEVIAVGPGISDLRKGDFVACGGNTANHSEVISVPRNLCVKIPEGVRAESAAMTTMGAIALQGIRQADLRLGECCVVIGLGLLGQLTLQMLEASGVKGIGIDIDTAQVEATRQAGLNAFHRQNDFLNEAILSASSGIGADAVIITAGSSSDDPVNLAGELCRQKGKVVIVGAVPTGFKRQDYFRKELDLRMSCSYGPGRYDPDYEESGIDYPAGYVRWTENRNMQAFLQLVADGKINTDKLISHRFPFMKAPDAYNLIVSRAERFTGIVLNYDITKDISKSRIEFNSKPVTASKPITGVAGAGSYAQNVLLPAISELTTLKGIVTSKPHTAEHIASKYGFSFCSGNYDDLINDNDINSVIITTRHDSHAEMVIKALTGGKHVYVEKPLCMSADELEKIKVTAETSGKLLMTGFNRRFSPLSVQLKDELKSLNDAPLAMHYRINAGAVPQSHWVHDPLKGGGRLIGEVCHFIDYCIFITGSLPESVSAISMPDTHHQNDTLHLSIGFQNGSIATVNYFSNGSKKIPKEIIEVFYAGKTAVIDDFTTLTFYGEKARNIKLPSQDKGHKAAFSAFFDAIKNGTAFPISLKEQYTAMTATFLAGDSIRHSGERMLIEK
jgi:polar amino acid transport system substrate-binding protein